MSAKFRKIQTPLRSENKNMAASRDIPTNARYVCDKAA